MFLRNLNPNLETAFRRKFKKRRLITVNQLKNLGFDHTFKTNFNNILFMNKFLKLNNREYLRKHRNRFKCSLKIMCQAQRKLKFHLARSKVRNSKNQLNYYDLAHLKTIKNLWNSFNFGDLKSFETKTRVLNRRISDEESELVFGKKKKLK